MYVENVESVYKYLHDFRMHVENVTIEITIVIENSRSLKLCQAVSFILPSHSINTNVQGLWASIQPTIDARK